MFSIIPKESLKALLLQEIECWESIGGGANPNAYEFDPKSTSPEKLKELGYYSNKEAWIAGARIKVLEQYLKDLEGYPTTKLNT